MYTYDHQSQGLSGRWLPDTQSTWVRSFDDYTHDFIYFVTRVIVNDSKKLPIYLLAHSMGGFVCAVGMARNPSLINRAILLAPMLRMKCGTRSMNMRFPIPQPIAHWIAYIFSKFFGLGPFNSIGFPNEVYTDKLALHTTTSDIQKLGEVEALRQKYPYTIATCVTNDWTLNSLTAQIDFSRLYPLVRTNCLIMNATKDFYVYNRAMESFANHAENVQLVTLPDTFHELLFEREEKRNVIENQILNYFHAKSDDIKKCTLHSDFIIYNKNDKIQLTNSLQSFAEIVIRGSALIIGSIGMITGLSLLGGVNSLSIYNLYNTILKYTNKMFQIQN